MTGRTHKKISFNFALVAMIIVVNDAMEFSYYPMVALMIVFSIIGAKFPDLDHNWDSVSDKNAITWVINKFIHLTGGRHRSRHTHSVDIAVIWTVGSVKLIEWMSIKGCVSTQDILLLGVMNKGFIVGWWSHLFADMLNYTGVYLSCLANIKIRIVPKQMFGVKFKTGEEWEDFVYKFSNILNIVLTVYVLLAPVMWMVLDLTQ